jgi:membrane protease YdiL (CAAX protease family)
MHIDQANVEFGEEGTAGAEAMPQVHLSAYRGFGLFALYIAAQLVIGVLAGFALGIGYALRGGDSADSEAIVELTRNAEGTIGVVAAILGGLGFVLFVRARHRGAQGAAFRRAIGLTRTSLRQVVAGAGSGIAIGVLYISLCVSLWPPALDITPGPTTQMAMSSGPQQQTWMLFALIGSPPIEEFVFRGVLLASILASWGSAWAAILTTGLFVGMHYSEFMAYWPAALGLTALSFAATVLRMRSGSLGPAVSAHLGYNLVMVVVAYASSAISRAA